MQGFPATMPDELVRSERPVAAISPGITYVIEQSSIMLDRDGGTWVKATTRCIPRHKSVRGYVSVRREDDGSLLLFGLDDPYMSFMLSIFEASSMKRKGYIPIDLIDPSLTAIGNHTPEEENYDHRA